MTNYLCCLAHLTLPAMLSSGDNSMTKIRTKNRSITIVDHRLTHSPSLGAPSWKVSVFTVSFGFSIPQASQCRAFTALLVGLRQSVQRPTRIPGSLGNMLNTKPFPNIFFSLFCKTVLSVELCRSQCHFCVLSLVAFVQPEEVVASKT